jgi:large subunit ribosomal protein L21
LEFAVYAVIETGGKQRRVRVGEVVRVEGLAVEPGSEVVFDRVLMVGNDGDAEDAVKVGAPIVEGASVKGSVVTHGRGKKIVIFTYKRRQNSNRHRAGHRQNFTEVKIDTIETI